MPKKVSDHTEKHEKQSQSEYQNANIEILIDIQNRALTISFNIG